MNSSTVQKSTVQLISPHLLDEKLKDEKQYWLQKMAGKLTSTGLPLDFVRPVEFSPEKESVALELDRRVRDRLLQVCGDNELLVFAVLVAALKICLHKYTGAEDIVLGTTIHNRYEDVASLNRVLVIRDQVSDPQSVKQLLSQVKRTLSEAYANQKYSFQRILELLETERTASRQPLFDIAVTLSNINDAEHLQELTTDLNVFFSVNRDQITGSIQYSSRLFKPDTIRVFARHLSEILGMALRDPDGTIGQLDLLSPVKRRELLETVNDTRRSYETDTLIHKLFEQQVATTPSATAVECQGRSVTFDQLNRRANQLAHYLQQLGVKPGVRVGLYLDHSIEMVVAVLGIAKAGGAYVPLDPSHPASRTAFILGDASIEVVLTQAHLVARLPASKGVRFCLDSQRQTLAGMGQEDPGATASPKDVVYVIYTSGSTGEPKGVEIEHRSLVNYILWAGEMYLRGDSLAFPLYSSFAFDLTVTSIFTPLITGNRMIIYPDGGLEHPLLAVLRENRVGVLKLTPSHLALIKGHNIRADQVRRLIVGGEAFTAELAREARGLFNPEAEIFNEYGPTEATVGCMIYRFNNEKDDRAFVAIGTPAANTQIYILDDQQRPAAENVVGQLFIGGDGLARGYLNRPQLTSERFIDNPFSPGKKLYKTGDMARWLPQGIVEYAGRQDDQVKFHGHRVELNEVRIALNCHPLIRDSVIVIEKEANGSDVMVAHYAAERPIETRELRAFLLDRVIQETIPNFFAQVTEIPLTANGKINYQALPSLEEARQVPDRTVVAPRNQTEELLASIWSKVLGREDISVTDDFFRLGGHSLLAHQIISRTRATFQIDVPLRVLFEASTIEKLAAAVDRIERERSGLVAPPLLATGSSDGVPLSYSQQRLWFMERLGPQNTPYNIYPFFQLDGPLNVAALQQCVNEVVRRHASLRTTFKLAGSQPVQVVAPSLTVPMPVVDLRSLTGSERAAEIERLTQEEFQQPFDLTNGPLIRARLLRCADDQHLWQLAMHHIVFDAWSMSIFYREISALYEAFVTRTSSRLPDLTVQYTDYAVWQRQWLQGEVLETQVAYWREQLDGAPPLLDLLPNRPRPAVITDCGRHQNVMFSSGVSDSVTELSREQGCTLFMTLLAAFQTLLYYYTGKEDIVVGSDVANRNLPEIEGLIGFFVNTLVLRTDLSGNPTFRSVLSRVRDICLTAYAHQDLPFEKLVEELNPARNTDHTPMFQIMFGFIPENPARELEVHGLELKFVPPDSGSSVFDFTFYMTSTPNGLGGTARYKSDLYDAFMIAEFLQQFELLLTRAVAQPDLTLQELHAILAEAARKNQNAKAERLKELRLRKFNKLKREPVNVGA